MTERQGIPKTKSEQEVEAETVSETTKEIIIDRQDFRTPSSFFALKF